MPISQMTTAAVRELGVIGTAHGRTPDPSPEVDPRAEDDPLDEPRDEAVVVFRGMPSIEVHLFADGQDTITVEQWVDFETPRSETLPLVDALLAGNARIGGPGGRFGLLQSWLQPFYGLQLVVPVAGREPYRQRVPYGPLKLWLSTLQTTT
ncbi:hypothetical protein [Pengzhenrongella phosphoraccumulans]|uniref:hypothetical protein n=1 Tax=Pengzhenrongella phosphoraccumulans TaxID=3114394 RepID=UPI003890E342